MSSSPAVGLGEGWLEHVQAQGGASPLLIVADHRAISMGACTWHEQLSAAGWHYRVRLGEVVEPLLEQEAVALAAEAVRFHARAILAVGGPSLVAVATAAARSASLPLVRLPAA